MEDADGYSWISPADDLEEAQRIVEKEAVAVRENCPEDEVDNTFPLYWSIKDRNQKIVASGHVNEHGEMYS